MNATDLPSWAWRDPAEVAERREAMTCTGCIFKLGLWGVEYCIRHDGRAGESMRRCMDYHQEIGK